MIWRLSSQILCAQLNPVFCFIGFGTDTLDHQQQLLYCVKSQVKWRNCHGLSQLLKCATIIAPRGGFVSSQPLCCPKQKRSAKSKPNFDDRRVSSKLVVDQNSLLLLVSGRWWLIGTRFLWCLIPRKWYKWSTVRDIPEHGVNSKNYGHRCVCGSYLGIWSIHWTR